MGSTTYLRGFSSFLSMFYTLKSTRGFYKFSSPQFYILQSTKRSTFPLHNSTSFNLPRDLHFLSTILHPSIYQEIYISSPQFYILQSTKRSTFPLHNSTSFNLPRDLH